MFCIRISICKSNCLSFTMISRYWKLFGTDDPFRIETGRRKVDGQRGGLLIFVAVISEIGGLTAGAVQLSRQTVIHPHSKNIGIHASRNASLVRALMSVSRKLCTRWENEKILRGNLGHVSVKRNIFCRNIEMRDRNFGKSARVETGDTMPVNLFSLVYIPVPSIFTVIFRKFHAGKFHVSLLLGRMRRLSKAVNDRLRPISESEHPDIYFYFPINALPSTRSLVQIAYYGSGYVFQVAESLFFSSFFFFQLSFHEKFYIFKFPNSSKIFRGQSTSLLLSYQIFFSYE